MMSDDLLLSLLQAGLLQALGDDDQRRTRAEAAAAATGEWLGLAGRPHLASAIMLAIDESGEPTGTAFDHAEQCLLHEWPTLRNALPEGASELLRAIVLQGVDNAAAADPELAAAAWYVTRTVREMSISAGRWTPVVQDAIDEINSAVNERLRKEWVPRMPQSKLVMPAVTPDEPVEAMKTFAAALGKDLRALLAQQAQLVEASRLRETLLWWRLAGQSGLLGARYGQVEDPATRALAAAGDLHQLCPAVAPESVEHLLADVVADSEPIDVQLSFSSLAEAWTQLSPRLGLDHTAGPLLGALSLGEEGALPSAMRRDLSPVEAAVVAFRDLQTTRLTSLDPETESSP